MAFPTTPTNGQTASVNGITYQYSTTKTAWTVVPNTLLVQANAAFIQANAAFTQANTATNDAAGASLYANAAFLAANNSTDTWVRGAANAASSYANSAYTQANTATTNASVADDKAVTSGSYANSAFSRANNSLQLAGGTIAGNVTANSFIANTSVYSPIYYSPGGTTNLVLSDIGIVAINSNGQETKFGAAGIESIGMYSGSYGGNKISLNNETNVISNRYDTVKIQTGTTGTIANEWSFSNNTLIFPDSSVQLIAYQGYGLDNVARYNANTGILDAASASLYANAAFLQANTATSDAASASLYANAAFAAANTGGGVDTWVRDAANAASSYANSAYTQANTATTNAATADSKAVTAGSYANSAFLHANAAFEAANTGGGGTPVSVTTDKFTANGSTSTFNLTVTPDNENLVTAVVDGIVQLRDTYILSGSIIQFDSTIYTNANVEITTISGGGSSGGGTSSAAAVGYSLIFGG